jgi:hypothetical protein
MLQSVFVVVIPYDSKEPDVLLDAALNWRLSDGVVY